MYILLIISTSVVWKGEHKENHKWCIANILEFMFGDRLLGWNNWVTVLLRVYSILEKKVQCLYNS